MSEPTTYHLARSMRVLAAGMAAAVAGIAVLVAALVSPWRDDTVGAIAWWAAVVIAVVAILAAGAAAMRLRFAPAVLTLDERGYQAKALRGVGVRAAGWKDVADVKRTDSDGQPVLVLRLHSGGRTAVPLRVIDEPATQLYADVDDRLNRAYGQRRLR